MTAATLSNDERKALMTLLSQLDQGGLSALTYLAIGVDASSYGSINDSMPVLVVGFMKWIVARPADLQTVIDHIGQAYPGRPEIPTLEALKLRLERFAKRAPADPTEALLIDTAVMVNRRKLRATLRELLGGITLPVVTVSGPTQSGRTHSWHLIRHVANEHGVEARRVDLNSWVVEQRTLDRLVDRLVEDFALKGFIRPTSAGVQPETLGLRYATEIGDCFGRLAPAPPRWLVFDSIDRPMAPEIAAFVRALCELRLNAASFANCTLFLLGADPQLSLSDGFQMATNEPLGPFLPTEVEDAAKGVNALGDTPLDDATLAERIGEMHEVLATEAAACCQQKIAQRLAALRQEVHAP